VIAYPAEGPGINPERGRGACGHCRHWGRGGEGLVCRHPKLPMPLDFQAVRDDSARCGSSGLWWAPLLPGGGTDGR
jgi:hypothetical protein